MGFANIWFETFTPITDLIAHTIASGIHRSHVVYRHQVGGRLVLHHHLVDHRGRQIGNDCRIKSRVDLHHAAVDHSRVHHGGIEVGRRTAAAAIVRGAPTNDRDDAR